MKTKILINLFIPSLLGMTGLYMLFYFIRMGSYKMVNWDIAYMQIIVFGLLWWLNTSDKVERVADSKAGAESSTMPKLMIFRILITCLFAGVSVYALVNFMLNIDYIFSIRTIIEGLISGILIFWLEYKSLSSFYDKSEASAIEN
jgi:hypothetical protein